MRLDETQNCLTQESVSAHYTLKIQKTMNAEAKQKSQRQKAFQLQGTRPECSRSAVFDSVEVVCGGITFLFLIYAIASFLLCSMGKFDHFSLNRQNWWFLY